MFLIASKPVLLNCFFGISQKMLFNAGEIYDNSAKATGAEGGRGCRAIP